MIASKKEETIYEDEQTVHLKCIISHGGISIQSKCTFHYMLNVLIIPKFVVIRATLTIDQVGSKSLHIYEIKKQFYISDDWKKLLYTSDKFASAMKM